MGVDKSYGSGKPLSAAQSASRRAAAGKAESRKKTVTAAAKQYGQKKGMYYTNPGMLASQKKRTTLDNRRTSANALENLTGFNSRDGVDAGDVVGLALAIPAGIGGAALRAGSRLARAASGVAKSSKVAAKIPVKAAKPINLTEVFAQQQAKRDANQWSARFPTISSAEAMANLQKASRGTPAGRGGMGGIRAGQRRPE